MRELPLAQRSLNTENDQHTQRFNVLAKTALGRDLLLPENLADIRSGENVRSQTYPRRAPLLSIGSRLISRFAIQ